jgi:hypothetical protein
MNLRRRISTDGFPQTDFHGRISTDGLFADKLWQVVLAVDVLEHLYTLVQILFGLPFVSIRIAYQIYKAAHSASVASTHRQAPHHLDLPPKLNSSRQS